MFLSLPLYCINLKKQRLGKILWTCFNLINFQHVPHSTPTLCWITPYEYDKTDFETAVEARCWYLEILAPMSELPQPLNRVFCSVSS
jgi:hypothetical protein